MAWLDLHGELEEEFADLTGDRRAAELATYATGPALVSRLRRSDPVAWVWEYAGVKRRRREKRQAKVEARGPCPHCKGPVTRTTKTGKVPLYCSPRCMQNETWKRWASKHKEQRRIDRRGEDLGSPKKAARNARHYAKHKEVVKVKRAIPRTASKPICSA